MCVCRLYLYIYKLETEIELSGLRAKAPILCKDFAFLNRLGLLVWLEQHDGVLTPMMSNRLAVSRKMMETLKSHSFRVWLRIWQAHASQMPAQLSSGTTGCEKSGIWALYCPWYKCEMLGIIEIIEVSQVTQKLELDSARYVQSHYT